MKAAIKNFWTWFGQNQKALTFLEEMEPEESERLYGEIDKRLEKVSDKLYFEIGEFGKKKQFIITTGGNPQYFSLAEEMVKHAPELESWEIVALKPALPKGSAIRLSAGGLLFDNGNMWFQPFRKPSEENSLLLSIFLKLPEFVEDQQLIAEGIFQMLYLTLGERSASLDIQTVEIELVEDEPQDRGIKPLRELPDFIEYYNRKRRGMAA